ncbi:MAG TPA: pitrilysin family protein [Symbiobacteriaceae bacterium]|nr:pitrilysin family protein [Symbiobacteriaceae bacterium]
MQIAPTGVHFLRNGLRILTREAHHAPVVSVMVWYGVGSRNEGPGQTGLSHFLEHMLFKGTPAFPLGAVEEGVKERGGVWNAFTSYDYTAYYEVLPSRHLEYGLELEADRMANLSFDAALTMRERGIIVAEKEGSENRPDYWLLSALMENAYQTFPYRHTVLGHKADIKAVTAEALTAHYRRYYCPQNATLVVVGDFETAELLRLAERHFGQIAPGAPVPPLTAQEAEQNAERRLEVRRPGPTAKLLAGYKLPPANHPDMEALQVLSTILSAQGGGFGRSSRLYRQITAKGLGTGVSASIWGLQHGGLFMLSGAPTPETTLEALESALWTEIERLQQDQVSPAEFARAQRIAQTTLGFTLESIPGQARLLGATAMSEGVASFDEMFSRLAAVTPADVQRVAQRYLVPAKRTTARFLPDASATEPSESYQPPVPAEGVKTPQFQLPEAERERITVTQPVAVDRAPAAPTRKTLLDVTRFHRRTLTNGATLLVYQAESLPSVLVRLTLEGGAVHDGDLPGLAALTAQLLVRGTAARSGDELALYSEGLGISLASESGRETAMLRVKGLADQLPQAIELLAEVTLTPTFPADELERLRSRTLVGLRQAANAAEAVSRRRLTEALYPAGHPYRMPISGTEESVPRITQADLVAFHAAHYRPNGAIFTVVGPVDPEQVVGLLESAFGRWTGGAGRPMIPPVGLVAPSQAHFSIAGKSQTDIALGWPLVGRDHPDFLPLELLATIFGGNGTPATSRLFRNLRERYGISYYQHAQFGPAMGPATWSVAMGVNPSRVGEAIDLLKRELGLLAAEPVPAAELAGLKAFLTDYPAVQLESTDRLVGRLVEAERFGLGADWVDRYVTLLNDLTAEQLQAVAARYLDPDRLTIITAGADPVAE